MGYLHRIEGKLTEIGAGDSPVFFEVIDQEISDTHGIDGIVLVVSDDIIIIAIVAVHHKAIVLSVGVPVV